MEAWDDLRKKYGFKIIDRATRDDYVVYFKIGYDENVIKTLREERRILDAAIKDGKWSVCDGHPLGYLLYVHARTKPEYSWWFNSGSVVSSRTLVRKLAEIGARISAVKFK